MFGKDFFSLLLFEPLELDVARVDHVLQSVSLATVDFYADFTPGHPTYRRRALVHVSMAVLILNNQYHALFVVV
jgi:hypothetical protein